MFYKINNALFIEFISCEKLINESGKQLLDFKFSSFSFVILLFTYNITSSNYIALLKKKRKLTDNKNEKWLN